MYSTSHVKGEGGGHGNRRLPIEYSVLKMRNEKDNDDVYSLLRSSPISLSRYCGSATTAAACDGSLCLHAASSGGAVPAATTSDFTTAGADGMLTTVFCF